METIGIEKATARQPAVVRGNPVHGVEAQDLEYLCDDGGTFLGRIDRGRVQRVELRGDRTEQSELQTDPPLAQRGSNTGVRGIGVHELKQPWCNRARVLQDQSMQE